MGLFSRKKKTRNSGSISAGPKSDSEPMSPGSMRKSQDEHSVASSITSHHNSQGGASTSRSQLLDQGLKQDENSDSGMNAEDKFMQYYAVKQEQSARNTNDSASVSDSASVRSINSNSSAVTAEERRLRAKQAVEERKRKAREAVLARRAKKQSSNVSNDASAAKDQEAEAAARKQQEEAQTKAEKEARLRAQQEEARLVAEAQARAEEEVILQAKEEALLAAEAQARAEEKAKLQAEAEAARLQAYAEADARRMAEEEEMARMEAEAVVKKQAVQMTEEEEAKEKVLGRKSKAEKQAMLDQTMELLLMAEEEDREERLERKREKRAARKEAKMRAKSLELEQIRVNADAEEPQKANSFARGDDISQQNDMLKRLGAQMAQGGMTMEDDETRAARLKEEEEAQRKREEKEQMEMEAALREAEEDARREAVRMELEEQEKKKAERMAKDGAERVAAEEEAARIEMERIAAEEEAARMEAERLAAEKAAEDEAARIAAEEAGRIEMERIAAEEEAARMEAERLAAEKAAEEEAARIAAEEEAARIEADRVAAEKAAEEEAARLAAAEEAARIEADRVAAEKAAEEEAVRLAAEEEAERVEAERIAAEEAARLEAEEAKRAEQAKLLEQEDDLFEESNSGNDELGDLDDLDALLDGDLSDLESDDATKGTNKSSVPLPASAAQSIVKKKRGSKPNSKPSKVSANKPQPKISGPPKVQRRASAESHAFRNSKSPSGKLPSINMVKKQRDGLGSLPTQLGSSPGKAAGNPPTIRGLPPGSSRRLKKPAPLQFPAREGNSYGSVATITSLPRSPRRPVQEGDCDDRPCCDNPYMAKLHAHLGPCQICVFRLSPSETAAFERNGRHIRVNFTRGGCQDCQIFPSEEDEEPVRICRQCFFDTHKLAKKPEAAFGGPSLMGTASFLKPTKSPYISSWR